MKKKSIKYLLLFFGIIILDQASKYVIRHVGGFYICNPNIAFGIKMDNIVFWSIWLFVVSSLLWILYRYLIHGSLYITLILAGAISNVLDRFKDGCITDFIDLKVWPVFNIADMVIVTGVIILISQSLGKKSKKSK